MVVLCGYPPGRRLRQGRIGFQGFVKHFDLPPFLVDCRDRVAIAGKITAYQIQPARAAVLVCKDLPNQKDFMSVTFQPAVHGLFIR